MKLRIISDIHLEFGKFKLPISDEDKNTTLIIAGDLGIGKMARPWLEYYCKYFKKVIYILGNHEFYHNDMNKIRTFWNTFTLDNLTVLDNSIITCEDFIIFGATLWTNFNNKNPMDMLLAEHKMNDFVNIKNNNRKLTTDDVYQEHQITINELSKYQNCNLIIITHHLPSFQSISTGFRNDHLSYAYASDLIDTIITLNPRLWIHGHTHVSFDYNFQNTRIICNPRGYVNYSVNKQFNPNLIIDV